MDGAGSGAATLAAADASAAQVAAGTTADATDGATDASGAVHAAHVVGMPAPGTLSATTVGALGAAREVQRCTVSVEALTARVRSHAGTSPFLVRLRLLRVE